jgi:hypothetical protein
MGEVGIARKNSFRYSLPHSDWILAVPPLDSSALSCKRRAYASRKSPHFENRNPRKQRKGERDEVERSTAGCASHENRPGRSEETQEEILIAGGRQH